MLKGSSILNILLFLAVVSILFNFVGGYCYHLNPANATECSYGFNAGTESVAITMFNVSSSPDHQYVATDFNLWQWIGYLLGASAIIGIGVGYILTGTFTFPNPYIYFGVFAAQLVISLVLMPSNLFGTLPQPLNYLLILGLGTAIVWLGINWYHTGENQ